MSSSKPKIFETVIHASKEKDKGTERFKIKRDKTKPDQGSYNEMKAFRSTQIKR